MLISFTKLATVVPVAVTVVVVVVLTPLLVDLIVNASPTLNVGLVAVPVTTVAPFTFLS